MKFISFNFFHYVCSSIRLSHSLSLDVLLLLLFFFRFFSSIWFIFALNNTIYLVHSHRSIIIVCRFLYDVRIYFISEADKKHTHRRIFYSICLMTQFYEWARLTTLTKKKKTNLVNKEVSFLMLFLSSGLIRYPNHLIFDIVSFHSRPTLSLSHSHENACPCNYYLRYVAFIHIILSVSCRWYITVRGYFIFSGRCLSLVLPRAFNVERCVRTAPLIW